MNGADWDEATWPVKPRGSGRALGAQLRYNRANGS